MADRCSNCAHNLTLFTGSNRKILLLALGFTGSTACMLFILVDPSIFLAGLSLTIVSVASLGSSFVLLNSFLPLLVANHPPTTSDKSGFEPVPLDEIPTMTEDEASLDDLDPLHESSETNGLFTGVPRPEMPMISDQSSSAIKLSNSISSRAIGVGYTASVLVQCIGITIIALFAKSKATGAQFPATMPLRTVLLFIGSVWASFTVPTAFWLRRRPGPPLPWNVDKTKPRTNSILSGFRYVVFAWVSLGRTIKVAFRLREVVKFLLGWFLLSDGVATITGTAILFAKVELKLAPAAVALLSITATVAGIIGAFCWPKIARYFGLSSISVVLCCIFLFEIIPLYGLLGFIPFIKGLGVIGMQQWWEIYPFGFLLGFIMGGISSYCRSIFGTLIPPGMEAAFYALFSVTDKGSSVIGPAVVGRIIDVTGSIRMGFWFLAFLMISPAPFFWFVDADKGRAEGLMMARRRIALHSAEEDTQDVQH